MLRRAGMELDLFHKAVLVGLWAAAVLYFYWTLSSRTFLYHWDYVNYILKQYHAEAAFAQSTGAGFRFLLDSITEDYTNFITLFTEFPFCLSGKTGDDYAFCQVFSVLPSLLVLLAGLTVKVGRMLRVKNRFWYFLIGFSWCATFPFVRMSAVLGQPDWFGLIFAFMLMLLTLDYRFDGIDLPRYLLIFAATAGIILTRRWYLYFVVGYCFAYVLLLAVSSIRLAKDGQPSRAVHRMVRLVVFGLCAAGAMVLLLLPMVRKILSFDYAGRYSYYNFGGITLELAAQALRIGLLNFILIGMGLWFATKRRLPALPCLAGTELLVSLVLFTRVQNTGSHQMLTALFGAAVLALPVAGCGHQPVQEQQGAELILRYAENQPEDYPTTQAALAFADLVAQRTDGRVKVLVYSGGELGAEQSVIQQMQFGGIDFSRVSLSQLAEYEPALSVLQLPYLYTDADQMWRVLDGTIGDEFLSTLESLELTGLSWFDAGVRSIYTRQKVTCLADLQGLTIRVQESDMMSEMITDLGAKPVKVVYSKVYAALHNGEIDGAENNWPSYEAMGHYEVAPYFLKDEHTRVPEVQLASPAVMEKLAALDERYPEIIRLCARESAKVERRLWAQQEAESESDLRAAGIEVTELDEEEKARFRAAVQPMYDRFAQQGELITRIRQA